MAAIGGCFLSWLHGAGTLLLHHPLDLEVYLRQIAIERPEYAIAPPAVLNMLIRDERLLASVDLSSLRCIGSGSAPLSPAMIAGFRDRLGIEIVNLFELEWPHRVSKAIETRIVDPDSGEEIHELGRPGELLVRGAIVFDGYFKAPEMTARVFTADGFYRTGDLFEIAADELGPRYYRYAGRCRQIIVRGGVKISPEEIDEVLATCPDFVEGAVVGVPDEVMGERICAVVVPRPGVEPSLEALGRYFESRGVAVFKWPERLRTVAQLPRNPVGKVVRAELLRAAMTPQT
jgi:non-ribosomal peptide synthetase component E (peptide arylation enzyme)